MNRLLAVLVVACLSMPGFCKAQGPSPTQAQARKFLDFECARTQDLAQSARNLTQMGAGLNAIELQTGNHSQQGDERILSSTSASALLAFARGQATCDMARMYSVMASPADRDFARGYLVLYSQLLVTQFDEQIQQINAKLPVLQSTAAVAEIGKLRDLLQATRDRANEFTPPSSK